MPQVLRDRTFKAYLFTQVFGDSPVRRTYVLAVCPSVPKLLKSITYRVIFVSRTAIGRSF